MPEEFTPEKASRPGLGTLVLIGFFLGIFCGLFFGELATVLDTVGRAYVRLLQMAIIPYITVSLISGLGRLSPSQASRIALWGGLVLLLILFTGLLLMLLIPLAYPNWEAASYFSSSLLNSSEQVDFVSLYISANPFDSLANTVVPAVVLFSIVMGVAVMNSPRKQPLLDILAALEDALMNITRFVVRLAPIGIFAIAANASGKLDLGAFDKLQVYLWSYLLLWALMFFVLLPGLLVAMTPLRYKEIFAAFRISFITAFVTGSVLVVLPMMIEEIRNLLRQHDIADEETDAAVDVLIPTTFNFPSVAMLLVLSFILFAGWYAGSPVALSNYPAFASVGLFVAFGGSNIALPFLLNMFQLPADLFDLFLVANVITNFFFMALAAMNLVVLTLLSVFLIKKRATPKPAVLLGLAALVLVAAPLMLKGTAVFLDRVIDYEYRGYTDFVARELVGVTVATRQTEYNPGAAVDPDPVSRLQSVEARGWLRAGHSTDALPWAFRNKAGATVGYDIQLLHRLAAEMGVGLEIVKIEPQQIGHALASGQIDIYASGLIIDTNKVKDFRFSRPYTETTLGLLVRDHERQKYEAGPQIIAAAPGSIGLLQSAAQLRELELTYPAGEFMRVASPRSFLRGDLPQLGALIMSAEAASAWTLVYPEYSTVIPQQRKITLPIVFGLPKSDTEFVYYVDTWIAAATAFGLMDAAHEYWILGQDKQTSQPRWSIIRDVLHWVD